MRSWPTSFEINEKTLSKKLKEVKKNKFKIWKGRKKTVSPK